MFKCKCGSISDERICPSCQQQKMPILVSFSGGRTSAFMSHLMLQKYSRKQLIFVFANTGQEHEKTLEFVHKVDQDLGLNLTWVEAVVHSRSGVSTSHRIVNFESATRDISLFKAMALKYGLPGPGWLHCTRELKERPIHSYMSSFIKKKKYKGYRTAIGIRADEIDRIPANYAQRNLMYPLADLGMTKQDVDKYWASKNYDLGLPDYLGNCVWCWKKSAKKLRTVAGEHRQLFAGAVELEKFANHGSGDRTRKMFRGHLSASEILSGVDVQEPESYENSCAESCEPFMVSGDT